MAAAVAAAGWSTAAAFGRENEDVELEELGPGVFTHAIMSGLLVGETMYLGSRYLDPTRVAALHVPSGEVTSMFTLGNGLYVEGLAFDGDHGLYAGVTNAEDQVNLYWCDLDSGDVEEAAAIPGLSIRDVAVGPDGKVFVAGTPSPSTGNQLFAYDPSNGSVDSIDNPDPEADQGSRVAATETTIYFGCNSPRSSSDAQGLYSIERASGNATLEREEFAGLTILDDVLVAGGAVMDLSSGEWSEFDVSVGAYARDGDTLYACSGGGQLYAVDLDSLEVSELDEIEFDSSWGILGVVDGLVVGGYRNGLVWTYDPDSGDVEGYDLLESGAEGGAETPQSIAAGPAGVYVAGNGAVALHDPSDGSHTNLDVVGEAKDMVVVDDVAYLAVYSSHGIWEHRAGEPLRQIAELPQDQNRPEVLQWDDDNELLVVGVKSDSTEGGSLCFYDPASGDDPVVHVNPLGEDQAVSAVAAGHGLVYIGGYHGSRQAGDIAAWDPVAGEEVWRLTDPFDGFGIASLVVVDDKLIGATLRGPKLIVVDLDGDSGVPSHISGLEDVSSENPALTVDQGLVYGVSSLRDERDGSLFRIDPGDDYRVDLLITDLNGEWFGRQTLSVDDDHNLYTLQGRELVRIRDANPPQG